MVHLNWIGTQLVRTNSIEARNSSNIIVVQLNSILNIYICPVFSLLNVL